MLKFVLDLIYPINCGICGESGEKWLCEKCSQKLNNIKAMMINDIYGKKYKKFIFLFFYDDIRDLILDYKFRKKSFLYHTFSEIILNENRICDELKKYDCKGYR